MYLIRNVTYIYNVLIFILLHIFIGIEVTAFQTLIILESDAYCYVTYIHK
jgi:hypothetical protein